MFPHPRSMVVEKGGKTAEDWVEENAHVFHRWPESGIQTHSASTLPDGKRNFVANGAGFDHSLYELDMLKFSHLLLVSTVILLFTRKRIETSTKQGSLWRCLASPEANEISSNGNAHVHCPCTVCAVCNCKRNCEKEDDIWIPVWGTHNQNISCQYTCCCKWHLAKRVW